MSGGDGLVSAQCDADMRWLVGKGRAAANARDLLAGLGRHLFETGMPVKRLMMGMPTLHPMVAGRSYVWRQGMAGCTEEFTRDHGVFDTEAYLNSPVNAVRQKGAPIRWRLTGPEANVEFDILRELADEGMTDYFLAPLAFTERRGAVVAFSTDKPEGFSGACLARAKNLLPVLGMLFEIHAMHETSRSLLETYIGVDAGQRVLNGQIKRGDASVIKAVLWYCDLRGFTPLSERLDGAELIGILNEYFERMAAPVRAHGGEVLKFIGDAMLAIFPLAERDAEIACNAALAAAREAAEAMTAYGRECVACGTPELRFGVALHLGEVTYGNIGAPDRLDFTVIGPAVNRVVRIEEQCRRLERQILVSGEVAKHVRTDLVSVGSHALRGVREAVELFGLPEPEKARSAAE